MPIKCPHCMSEIPDGATVCAHCGAYSQTQKQLGCAGCVTLPLAIVLGVVAGVALVAILMLVAAAIEPGAIMPVMFFGLIILPVLGAVIAVKLLPGKKERIWTHKR